ncbi:MAG: metallophosphoesterase [Solirubrobacterales bacterium]
MKVLAFSDLHCDRDTARRLVEASAEVDLVIGAGDFASQHRGLEDMIIELAKIETPTLLIPGNNETEDALRSACAEWDSAQVLHGSGTEIGGIHFYGLGAGIPTTPWDWSFDLTEEEAEAGLSDCPAEGILVVHSPPYGHCDQSAAGEHLGSHAIRAAIEQRRLQMAVCGHIHESWGTRSEIADTPIANLGPDGTLLEL